MYYPEYNIFKPEQKQIHLFPAAGKKTQQNRNMYHITVLFLLMLEHF